MPQTDIPSLAAAYLDTWLSDVPLARAALIDLLRQVQAAEATRAAARAAQHDPDTIALRVVRAFPGDEYWIDSAAAVTLVSDALRAYAAAILAPD